MVGKLPLIQVCFDEGATAYKGGVKSTDDAKGANPYRDYKTVVDQTKFVSWNKGWRAEKSKDRQTSTATKSILRTIKDQLKKAQADLAALPKGDKGKPAVRRRIRRYKGKIDDITHPRVTA